MKSPKKILIIIQRSNGDVFLSATLINVIYEHFHSPQIDLLVNDDTFEVASLLPRINYIHTFSYKKKTNNRWTQEKELIRKLFRRYDLSINLTSSDRSVVYALLAGKKTISAVEKDNKKSWWKKILLTYYYYFDINKHIFLNNLEPLNLLEIQHDFIQSSIEIKNETFERVKNRLNKKGIKNFIIFHPSAQYKYKIYPKDSRDKLITFLSKLGISIIVTGTNNKIDTEIKRNLLSLPNVFDLIGETSLEEYFALSSLSQAYIGMDTLNMHIASAQNKHIFAIFGPTKLSMWAPWSNQLQVSATDDMAIQTYGNVTIFQADMPCVACGKAGCKDSGKSECLDKIKPKVIFDGVEQWYQNDRL